MLNFSFHETEDSMYFHIKVLTILFLRKPWSGVAVTPNYQAMYNMCQFKYTSNHEEIHTV